MKKIYKINKKRVILCVACVVFVLGMFYFLYHLLFPSHIILTSNTQEVEINSQVDYSSFIKEIKDGDKNNVKINSQNVLLNQLGEYIVVYEYEDEKAELKLKVVDTIAPKVQLKTLNIAQNQKVKADDFIEKIIDSTKTKVSFQKQYDFSKVGKQNIEIVVEDEGGNQTIEKTSVDIKKDDIAPNIIGSSFSVKVGEKIDLEKCVLVKDNYDAAPQLIIEKDNFDIQKAGVYHVKYIAKDFAGNQSEKMIDITVTKSQTEKVVYLTFDDGPSKYTSQVLNILKKYNCKASFFVTGMNPKYRQYIKTAHEQGHTIGLHTYSNSYKTVYSSVDAYFNDLDKAGNMVKEYIGFVPKYIRFPGGSSNTVSRKYTKGIMTQLTKEVIDKGYQYYDWNAENGDGYARMAKSQMIKRATSSSKNHIMILMHDANGKQNTIDTLPTIIKYYQKRGYVFKAIDETTPIYHQHVNN